MDIVLIRHAQPHWEPEGIADDNPELTDLGRRQAVRVAEALSGEEFDVVYASPLRRARETVAPIAARLGLEPRFHDWLAELRLPVLGGKTREEVQAYFEEARARDLSSHHEGFPGGESFADFRDRVVRGMDGALRESHSLAGWDEEGHRLWDVPDEPQRLLFVAHEGTNSLLLSHLLGIEAVPWSWMKFSSAWAGITRLHLTRIAQGAVWSMECFNEVTHLAGLDTLGRGRSPRVS